MVFGTATHLIGLKHFQAVGDLMCAGLLIEHGQQVVNDELDISIIVERGNARWVEDFLVDTDHSRLQLYKTVYKANDSLYQCYLSTVRCYH